MKTITLILVMVSCWSLTTAAQGVHLVAGDSLTIGFNGVGPCQFTEGAPGTYAGVGFGSDILGPGESIRMEMFEDTLAEAPFATQTYNPATPVTGVALYGPFSHWLDYQGLIRVDMLTGSVDVIGAHFVVSPNPNTYCTADVSVPEPNAIALAALGGLIGGAVWFYRRQKTSRARGVP